MWDEKLPALLQNGRRLISLFGEGRRTSRPPKTPSILRAVFPVLPDLNCGDRFDLDACTTNLSIGISGSLVRLDMPAIPGCVAPSRKPRSRAGFSRSASASAAYTP